MSSRGFRIACWVTLGCVAAALEGWSVTVLWGVIW